MNRILCHNDINASVDNGGFVRFPKYLMLKTYRIIYGLDYALWSSMSLASKSVFPVILYFVYISEDHKISIASQETLRNLSGIGSRNTIKKACDELCSIGIYNRIKYKAYNENLAYCYNINTELEAHAKQNFLPLPKYVIKNGLWAKLGSSPVAQALYWAMRSFECLPSDSQAPVCSASRNELCERAGISKSSFDKAQRTLAENGFLLPD